MWHHQKLPANVTNRKRMLVETWQTRRWRLIDQAMDKNRRRFKKYRLDRQVYGQNRGNRHHKESWQTVNRLRQTYMYSQRDLTNFGFLEIRPGSPAHQIYTREPNPATSVDHGVATMNRAKTDDGMWKWETMGYRRRSRNRKQINSSALTTRSTLQETWKKPMSGSASCRLVILRSSITFQRIQDAKGCRSNGDSLPRNCQYLTRTVHITKATPEVGKKI